MALPKEGRQFTHIEKLEYKIPLTENIDKQQLRTEIPTRAAVDAVHAAMLRYGLAVAPEEAVENTSPLKNLFKPFDKN